MYQLLKYIIFIFYILYSVTEFLDLLMPKGDLSQPVDGQSSRNLLASVVSTPNLAKPLGEVRIKLKYTVFNFFKFFCAMEFYINLIFRRTLHFHHTCTNRYSQYEHFMTYSFKFKHYFHYLIKNKRFCKDHTGQS